MKAGANVLGRIIAITNQKGGVGKTTTSVNLSACIAYLGKKVLLIDIDPQGNATSGIGVNKGEIQGCIYDVLIDDEDVDNVICHTKIENLDVIPATISLAGAEIELVSTISREVRLKHALQNVKEKYDYILIDCPPSLGLLTINALTASDAVIIPVQCEYYALEGLADLTQTIDRIQQALNPDLQIVGVLRTMYDARNALTRDVSEELQQYFGKKLYDTVIPRNIRLAEAPAHGLPVIYFEKSSKGAVAYLNLAAEVLKKSKVKKGSKA